jgi:hypothetical protein
MSLTAPAILPFKAVCIAFANPVDCARLKAVPASIALTLKLLFALLRGAALRGAI